VSATPAATRYRGPLALGDDLRRVVELTVMLAATDFKLRFFGSALGYLWTLTRPLLLFGVLYFVFTEVVRFGAGVDHYPVYLLSSIVLFSFFAEATARGVNSLVERENLLRKIRFPRLVIPLSVTLNSLFNLALNLVAVFVFVFASGITPRLSWLEVPVLVGILVLLATGVTMLLSALFIDSDAPTAAEAIGGWELLAIPFVIVVGVFALGAWVFKREAPRIAENL
jgi:ABC-2 type transport system permease protein